MARNSRWCAAAQAGYSIIELIFAVGIMSVLASMAVFQIGQSRPAALGDGAMRVVLSQLTAARERAITERRNMRLTFTGTTVAIIREEAPGTVLTPITAIPFEGGLTFNRIASLGDTPDAFAPTGSSAVNLPTATGNPLEVKFTPEGTFVNQNGLTLNATIFVSLPNDVKMSARAVTIMGTTGRIRGFRWDGGAWKPV